jgi:hypothetical protein
LSSEGIEVEITSIDDFSETFNRFISESNEISSSVNEVTSSTEDLSSASTSMSGALEQATSSEQAYSSSAQNVATTSSEASEAQQEAGNSAKANSSAFKESAQGIASTGAAIGGTTMAVVGLSDSYTRLQDAQLRYNTAQANAQKAEETLTYDKQRLTEAQDKLNALVESGVTSGTKYQAAQRAVASAQQTVTNQTTTLLNAQNSLGQAQNKLALSNEQVQTQWLMMGTSVIPMLLTQLPEIIAFTTGYGAAEDALTLSQAAQSAETGIATAAQWLWNAALDANPIGIVIIAIMGLVAAIGVVTGGFKNWTPVITAVSTAFNDLKTAAQDIFNFFDNIFGNQIKAWMIAMQDFWNLIQPIVQGMETIANGAGTVMNAVSGAGNAIGGAISSIPGLAEGGIVSKPTIAMIGERGSEAVIPLSKFSSSNTVTTVTHSPHYHLDTDAIVVQQQEDWNRIEEQFKQMARRASPTF